MALGARPVAVHGPPAWAAVLLAVLLILAAVVNTVVVARATRGVSGVSELQGRYYGWSWVIGFIMLFSIEGALAHRGASAEVMGMSVPACPCW